MEEKKTTVLIDGIASVGVHNGIVRVSFFRLTPEGKTEVVLELQIPQNQLRSIIEGLSKVRI